MSRRRQLPAFDAEEYFRSGTAYHENTCMYMPSAWSSAAERLWEYFEVQVSKAEGCQREESHKAPRLSPAVKRTFMWQDRHHWPVK